MFDFLKLDLLQLVEVVKPWMLPIIWFIIFPFGVLRSTPVIGIIASRVPIFILVCLFSTSFISVIFAIIILVVSSLLADILAYTKMYSFWLKLINKIPQNSTAEKMLQKYEKYPISVTIIGTYSSATCCFLAPFARKYNLHWLKFWIPRYITITLLYVIWGIVWFSLKENASSFSEILTNIGLIVLVSIFLGIIFNIFYSIRILSEGKVLEKIKTYFRVKNR